MRKGKGAGRALIVILILGGFVGYQVYTRINTAKEVAEETAEGAIMRVSVVNPQPGPKEETLTLPGTADAWYQAPIYAQVSGYVKMWYKDYGARVKEGDLLAEINTPTLDAQYSEAQANLRSAEAKYNLAVVTADRWRALRKSQAVSEQSISVQEANEKSEAALVDAAKQNVVRFEALQKFKKIVAPFDGVITSRAINVGDYVDQGHGNMGASGNATELFSVADTHAMRLFVSVPEVFASILKPELVADVVVPQYPERHFTAKYLTTAKGFDTNTRTVVTEFIIDNDDAALWPGSYATVKLTAPADPHILTVPTSSLVFEEEGLQVATVTSDNHVHFKPVTSGKILGEQVQITLGLTKEDRIVDNPPAAIMEGQEIKIVPATPGYNTPVPNGETAQSEAPQEKVGMAEEHAAGHETKK